MASNIRLEDFLAQEAKNGKLGAEFVELVETIAKNKNVTIPMDVMISFTGKGRASIKGKLNREIALIINEALDRLKLKARYNKTTQVVSLTPRRGQNIGTLLGNYFEGECYRLLAENKELALLGLSFDAADRTEALLKAINSRKSYSIAKREFMINEVKKSAERAVTTFVTVMKNTPLEERLQNAKLKTVEWLGGGGGIGDLKVTIDEKFVLMVECKYYQMSTIERYGLGYFNFNDDAFSQKYAAFLKNKPGVYWQPPRREPDVWVSDILTSGFYNYLGQGQNNNSDPEILSYLLDKAHAYNILNYFKEDGIVAGQRALLYGERVIIKEQEGKISTFLDLRNLPHTTITNLSIKTFPGNMLFYGAPQGSAVQQIAYLRASDDTVNSILAASQEDPEKTFWESHFQFKLTKHFFDFADNN